MGGGVLLVVAWTGMSALPSGIQTLGVVVVVVDDDNGVVATGVAAVATS